MQGSSLHCHHLSGVWAQDEFHNVTQFEIRNRFWGETYNARSAGRDVLCGSLSSMAVWEPCPDLGEELVSVPTDCEQISIQGLAIESSCWESQLPSTWKTLWPKEGSYWSVGSWFEWWRLPLRRRGQSELASCPVYPDYALRVMWGNSTCNH